MQIHAAVDGKGDQFRMRGICTRAQSHAKCRPQALVSPLISSSKLQTCRCSTKAVTKFRAVQGPTRALASALQQHSLGESWHHVIVIGYRATCTSDSLQSSYIKPVL